MKYRVSVKVQTLWDTEPDSKVVSVEKEVEAPDYATAARGVTEELANIVISG